MRAKRILGRARQRLLVRRPQPVASGVWLVRGGLAPWPFNVYLLEDGGRLTAFDAGSRPMAGPLASAAGGRIARVVLGHGHADHRGGARPLGVPVACHPAERPLVEGDAGESHFSRDGDRFFGLRGMGLPFSRAIAPPLMRHWDGGPVEVTETVSEGDVVCGFEVVHLPGHTPGSIALWRKRDRVALTSDCFYTFGFELPLKGPPRLPTEHYNFDTELARASLRKLADLRPSAAWPGHFDPVLGDVRGQLIAAAEAPA